MTRLRTLLRAASLLLAAMPATAAPADPLSGSWKLDLARTHYGATAEPRLEETFDCRTAGGSISCAIHSVRTGGRVLDGAFEARYDGLPHPARGIPGVDQVTLTKVDDSVADAVFCLKGVPVFAYRAFRSADGRHLTIVSVDPATRAVLGSVVAYESALAPPRDRSVP